MIGKRGYKEIFSTYDPAVATELDETIESVREVFVNSAVDSRIEEALPILAKIKENTMKEANQFENWTNQIMEGTWALPETAEDMARLQELMSKPLPCGPDGEYASEQLYDLIGDDSLFDDIGELADKDPDADCREIVKARAQELGVDIDVEVGESINENPTDQETASSYQAGQANAAAGKERSMGMNLGGEKAAMKQTAGGSDVEESVTGFVNPNDQDGTDNEKPVDMMAQDDLDSEDMTENEEMEDLLRLAGRGNVNEAKSPPEVINPTKDSSPADLKAAMKYAKYMKAKMDTDKAKATYDKEIAQLQGWMKAKSVTKETQDVDTGKQALKAERDPMLERILYLAKG